MQTSTRSRDHAGGYRGRHGPQISISDDNHHVTDAISSLYDYGEQQQHQQPQQQPPSQARRDARPLSFLPSARDEIQRARPSPENTNELRPARPLSRTQSDKLHTQPHSTHATDYMVGRSNSAGHGPINNPPSSPLRSPAETAAASFPLNDIDYESSPAAVAQELSNLQAIRRMSMDVNVAGDPDLPSFSPGFGIPTVPPTESTDEDDASRLFWVPARLHPELAPKEFRTFLDSRVESIKRRSGEFSPLTDGPTRSGSDGGLKRKKSMLSRQIDNSEGARGYQDGAERLDRKRSQSDKNEKRASGVSNLQELEMLMNDPQKMVQRLSLDTKQGGEGTPVNGDMPILPAVPGGPTLKRSTRTTYRKGSLRQGERLPPSKRAARAVESDSDDLLSPKSPTMSNEPFLPGITRVQTDPTPARDRISEKSPPENFSRPGRSSRPRVIPQITSPPPIETNKTDSVPPSQKSPPPPQESSTKATPPVPPVPSIPPFTSREPKRFVSQIASNGRTTANIPSINEPADDQGLPLQQGMFPDRKSSMEAAAARGVRVSAPPAPIKRPSPSPSSPNQQYNEHQPQTLQHMTANPSPLPGNNTRTDSLSFIPTLTEDKRPVEPKKSTKKSGWSWGSLLGSEEKEKEKERAREDDPEIREIPRSKPKSKLGAKTGDNTRLDVLQQTMESSRGRESIILDRGDPRLEEERKKESSRKSSSGLGSDSRDTKRDKDGLFSSLFGTRGKKSDRDSLSPGTAGSGGKHKSSSLRPHSPEPPRPALKPDVDYNWTRFSILEERAIYRMAHIKLANPRRALYSQVLLSNFMYSYLAKVQQMHPQIQIPQSAAQKAAQQRAGGAGAGGGAGGKKEDQPEEFYQYQRYQQQLQAQDHAAQQQQQPQSSLQNQHQPYQMQNPNSPPQHQLPYHHQQLSQSPPNGLANYLEDHADSGGSGTSGGGADGYLYQQQRPQHSAYQYTAGAGVGAGAGMESMFEESEESDDEDGPRVGEMW